MLIPTLTGKNGMDAVIMAGGPQSVFAKSLPNKTFIKIRGRALFIHVLATLVQVDAFGRIFIVGPKRDLEKEMDTSGLDLKGKQVITVQEANSLVGNMLAAFRHSTGLHLQTGNPSPAQLDQPIFAIGGDSPLVLPEEVTQFLSRCDLAQYDYFLGMTPADVMDRFKPTLTRRGISMAYTHFAEDAMRINNMHLVKPLRVVNQHEFNEIYRLRHLRNPLNILKLAYALTKRHFGLRDWTGWLGMFMAMALGRLRLKFLSTPFRKNISLERVERVASRLLGTRAKIVVTTCGGAALDVDKLKNVAAIEENFYRWTALQREPNAPRPGV
ncbi:MAG: NTP transferase domain-containing protein [Nitrospinae bacterium]|nr:NTP transferase domain-containing protein [Nitrospinota bacterium]